MKLSIDTLILPNFINNLVIENSTLKEKIPKFIKGSLFGTNQGLETGIPC